MIDKQIIIDGVDVSKCECFKDGMCYAECDLEGYTDWECKDAELSNCYFKQLARKTQECEELKERLERIEEDLKYQCVDCMNIKSDRYRKTLNEIEKACLEDTYTFADGTQVRYDTLNDILDIINKVRGNK